MWLTEEKLFDDRKRADSTKIKHGETLFQYYDRCSAEHANNIRALLNSWIPELPSKLKEKILLINMQNQKKVYEHNKNFISLIYEVYIYKMLLGLGVEGGQIKYEQQAANGKYPEFFIEDGEDSFYVEATVAGDIASEERVLSEIIDTINNEIISDLYNLRITTFAPSVNGKHSKIIQKKSEIIYRLNKWLSTLVPASVMSEKSMNIDHVVQKLILNFRGLGLIFKPIIHDEYLSVIVSVSPYMANVRETDVLLRKKVERKHDQLKNLEYPCVLAINTLYDFAAGEWDLTNALLGDVCMSFSTNPNEPATSFRRANGVFGPHESQHNFLAGVILSPGLGVGNIHRARTEFLINPWATRSLKTNNILMQLKRMTVDPITCEVSNHDGKDIANIVC